MKIEWSPKEIKAFRVMLNLNQSAFAKAVMIDRQQSVSEWERGIKPIRSNRILLGQLYERFGSPVLNTGE